MRQQVLRAIGDDLGDDPIDRGAPALDEGVPTDQHLLRFGIGEASAWVLHAQLFAHRASDANRSLIEKRGGHAQFGLSLELVLVLQGHFVLVKLPAPDIQREVLDDIRLHRDSVHRVVPGDERTKGLWIGVEFDQAHVQVVTRSRSSVRRMV